MAELKLIEYRHPDKVAQKRYDALIGIDNHKQNLLFALQNILDSKGLNNWLKKFHPKGLPYIENLIAGDCLVMLSGDVGCGKTELAHTIATPLSKLMGDESLVLFETPSNIRGGGHVGELSSRITAAFDYAKSHLRKGEFGILLIDEADDLATNRDQMQAHHEDRSGVNVLIKEIDKIQRENLPLAVILITNRPNSIDPAVARRASLHLSFIRPNGQTLKVLFERVFEGSGLKTKEYDDIVKLCESKSSPYSYSDITKRVAKQSLIVAWQQKTPITKEIISSVIERTVPSPQIINQ